MVPSAQPVAPAIRVTPERPDSSASIDDERKTVTAVFADLKGSTELMEDLDPEEARAIVDPALRIMIDAVRRYEGYVVQSTGDGIFALFGAPAAYEDHPQRGIYAALKMQQELGEYSRRLASHGALRPKPVPPEARVGVHTGEVVVRTVETGGKIEYTPIGHTVNLASRLQTLAPPGSIAVSEHTRRLVEGYFELRALGPAQVKGISEPINVYEVTGLGPLRTHFQLSARRGLTKFVGRDREIAGMRRALESAISGRGQLVAVVAEAGSGKSRLFHEFKATLPAEYKVLEAYSVSYGKTSAWLPVLELLRNYFDLEDADDSAKRREKVRAGQTAVDPALSDALPYLFALLGIQEDPDPLAQIYPQVKRQRTLDAIKRVILRESLEQPVVVIFEDLHWIDSQTQALLDLLADSLPNARVLLLVNYRPEYRHEWGNKSYYSQLRLDPLDSRSAGEMLATLLGESSELEPLKQTIIQRTGGNPFFIEEMLQALFDESALVRNGVVKLVRPFSQLRLPPTVQGILASRIDRQPGEHKQLLQTLAVLGKESPLALIRQVVSTAEPQLEQTLADLRAAEFIYEQPATTGVEYAFKHALTQEVAYNSLLIERRKQIHERAAQAIEALFAPSLSDRYDDLAHHYRRSGNSSKAVGYLRLAAEQAMSRSAYAEARDQLNSALELLHTQGDELECDRTEIAVRLDLAICIKFTGGRFETATLKNLERARELCENVGDDRSRFKVLDALADQYHALAEHQKLHAVGEELIRIARHTHNSEMVGHARFWLGTFWLEEGNFTAAAEEFELACKLPAGELSLPDSLGWDLRIRTRSLAALAWWMLGFPERALAKSAESFDVVSRITASPSDLVLTLFWSSVLNLRLRDWKMVCSQLDEAIRLAHEHGFMNYLPLFCFERGLALARLGQIKEGLAEMLQWESALMRATSAQGFVFWGFADVYLAIGRPREGLEAAEHGLEVIRAGSEYEAELRRLKGELLLLISDNSSAARQADQCFRDAIDIADRQRAKSWELRATMSLARLLAKQGRRDEARAMLAEIYRWFTEGFDTTDFKDAKALLDELTT
jgi:class 3 adenylate cyclase/tetratricopeptide (TPR) repeat protein